MKQNVSFSRLLVTYVIGFNAALLLSIASYLIVTEAWLGDAASLTMLIILGLAVVQLVIQLVCFLHMGADRDPFSRTGTFLFTIGMALIIVIGSLWIMQNLDYRMHISPDAMQEYMLQQNKKGF